MNDMLKKKLKLLPESPGCYIYKNKYGEIIYIGKAKILKNRVRSYFSGKLNKKTENLVKNIVDLDFIIVNSEKEALILENNLIKKYKPYYNIKLKDDKSYPYLMITRETHPRLLLVRKFNKNSKDIYFGPYVDIKSANNLKKIVDKIYPLRKCNPIEKRPCTYYQVGECIGPCAKNIEKKEYTDRIKKIKNFLSGQTESVVNDLSLLMQEYINVLDFENAQQIHEYINSIKKSIEKQIINSNGVKNIDYIGYYYNENYICIQMFLHRFGSIIERKVEYFDLYTDFKEILLTYLNQYYLINKPPHEIYIDGIDEDVISNLLDIKAINPSRGRHAHILKTVKSNAKYYLENEINIIERKEEKVAKTLKSLSEKLMVKSLKSIDIFDNSNIMGRDAVSVKVNFLNGKKNTYGYRKYKVKTVQGANDIATMKEVLLRTYKDKDFYTNLIIVDGGENHVKAAIDIIHRNLNLDIKIIGLVKNTKHITEYIVTDNFEIINLKKDSEEYHFFKRMQDEVHRFAITYHKRLRNSNMFNTPLDKIKGIGNERKKRILQYFSKIEDIKNASDEEFKKIGIPQSIVNELKKNL
ncbi:MULTISPECIES: excinuclease ABC subunit UvrC [unclassified Gemella]|uniref:excinuclease ABC subunit UvrC n=1 Tax=unclassified Gemella TaxID=2624949 RepID=UPI00107453DF|nr:MULTISPECIES: excinuclease ABC subunit UvrC [unclassified Gemella]MBF0710153.1 excinuclease ABC subunit C [Gemella sp. GL1.1]MBF0746232.1 excinuclease ABC subunit C [Gemella sp. 19428wG2_WT2a]NYS27497.1 excinuclease ABC subunit C [Gemella sp. GL1]TFU60514.1 excinuclease ABC subunit C [Gemella sp. WT2a]